MAFKDGELPKKFRVYTSGGLLDQMIPSPDFIEYQRKINEELLNKVTVFDPARSFLGFDTGTDPDQLNIKVKRKHKLKFNFNN